MSSRSATQDDMSTSTLSSKLGAVARDSDIRRATIACSREGSMTEAMPFAVSELPFGLGWLGPRAAGADCAAAVTSASTIRAAGPLPLIPIRSTPRSVAARRASGEALTRASTPSTRLGDPPPAGAAEGGAVRPSAEGAAAATSAGSDVAEASSPGPTISAIGAPSAAVSPAATRICASVPSTSTS